MNYSSHNERKNMLAFTIVLLGILSRVFIHLPNFTPVIALALFGGAYLNKRLALIVPLAIFAISDLIIGFHDTMFFTWGAMIVVTGVGFLLRQNKSKFKVAASAVVSSILFFIISNFGAWMAGSLGYPMTLAGLLECYIMALPFFPNTLISTLVYAAVLFGGFEYASLRLKKTRLAFVL